MAYICFLTLIQQISGRHSEMSTPLCEASGSVIITPALYTLPLHGPTSSRLNIKIPQAALRWSH